MKTETNWEDNQLMQDALRARLLIQEREDEIRDVVNYHLNGLKTELRHDYNLSDREIIRRIMDALP